MLVKKAEDRGQLEFVNLENMVPQDHLLRKIDAAIDFKKIYEFVEDLYCEDNGRPSVDPVVLFKIVLIQHIYGLPSLRRTLEEVSMNLAYRWFIGYPLNEAVPHFSTVSYNFKHRFNHATVEHVFRWVLKSAAEEGYLDTEAIFVDGTHIQASANLKKQAGRAVPKQAKRYAKELFEEVNKDREEHGKKPFSEDSGKKPPEERETVVSTTDPESAYSTRENTRCDLPGVPCTALFHHKPGRLPGIQEPGVSLQNMSHKGHVHRKCQVRKNVLAPYLAGVCGNGGGYPAHGGVQRVVPSAKRED